MNLDKIYNYEDLYSQKWVFRKEITGEADILPMWIADMDFETAPAIKRAIAKRADTGIYGYAEVPQVYDKAIIDWFAKRHHWKIEKEQIVQTPGVVSALTIGVHAFSEIGDAIIVLTPVYHPFFRLIRNSRRKILESRLIETDHGYVVDFEDFEKKIIEHQPKVFILCNPHNPIGKVYTKNELQRLGEICLHHNVIIISDEIHCDIIFSENLHIPLASVSDEIAQNTVVCTALSKTFNIAGLQNSNIIIPNKDIRKKYTKTSAYFGYPHISLFPVAATIAGYTEGEAWLDEVLTYIEANRDYALDYIGTYLPQVHVHKPDGTYFLWLDFRDYGWTKEQLEDFLLHKAKVWFNQGYIYGSPGEGFARANIACPREILEKALLQITEALSNLTK